MHSREIEQVMARLRALEFLVIMVLADRYVPAPLAVATPLERARTDTELAARMIERMTMPGVEASLADMRADETARSARELLGAVMEVVKARLEASRG